MRMRVLILFIYKLYELLVDKSSEIWKADFILSAVVILTPCSLQLGGELKNNVYKENIQWYFCRQASTGIITSIFFPSAIKINRREKKKKTILQ